MPLFEHDGLRFHYRESGSGVPFIFQHGLGADANQIFDLFRPPPGFRLITMECRGHGETRPLGPEEKIRVETFTDDVRALLDHLGIERAVIGGISMGAAIALRLALEQPERALGLIISRPAWLEQSRADNLQVFSTLAEFIRKYGAWEGAQRYQETAAYRQVWRDSPDSAKSLLAQFAHPRAGETVVKLERIPAYIPAHTREHWETLRLPVLILANRQDPVHPFEFGEVLAQAIPGARLVEVTPKSVSVEQHGADVQRALEDFLVKNFPATE